VARLGGDEFMLLLQDTVKPRDVELVAAKVLESLSLSYRLDGHEAFVSGSIGIALYPEDGQDGEILVRNADTAMYRAKHGGKNAYSFFASEMQEVAQRRMALETDLRRAIDRNEFALYYQPIVELATGRIAKAEALIRWTHPERGPVSPAEFIPLAEEAGLIHPIGEWVVREALDRAARWQRLTPQPPRIGINVSPRQWQHTRFRHLLAELLLRDETAARGLGLEITESLFLHASRDLRQQMDELRGQGIEIAIDDFGTGYSSLSYLKRFPVDLLKIDQSFVRDLGDDPGDRALVLAILGIAKTLDIAVVAEGVETELQAQFLREQECTYAQGYLFSRPLPADDLRQWLHATPRRAAAPRAFACAAARLPVISRETPSRPPRIASKSGAPMGRTFKAVLIKPK